MNLKITTLATGSSGNSYHLKYGEDQILIEAGISINQIKQSLKYRLSDVSGCLVTHSHRDHSKAAMGIIRAGIDLYVSAETASYIGANGHRLNIIKDGQQFRVGKWTVLPFKTEHDCDGSLGFLLAIGKNKILFATDTSFIRNTFSGLTHIMIECNYCDDLIQKNVSEGLLNASVKNRTIQTHFGLNNVLAFLKANNLEAVKEIHLIHLSDSNADAGRMKKEIMAATGKTVIINY